MSSKSNRRIMMDIQNIHGDDMESLRIFYKEDLTNIYKGLALIFGPEGTIYEDLPVILEIEFPKDYPFTNPKVTFMTSDGLTRFHPNLYQNGKVCLSILGTWSGPSWTSVMTLKTVLLSIMGLLDNEPLLHEPAYSALKGCQNSKEYSSFVEHASLRYIVDSLERFANKKAIPIQKVFEEEFAIHAINIYKRTHERLKKLAEKPTTTWNIKPYKITDVSIYPKLLQKIEAIASEKLTQSSSDTNS